MGELQGKRVLLVEDELFIAMHAEEILRDLGAEIVGPASSLQEAWSFVENETFDCAMLDRNLNGEFSDELAQELKRRGVAVILASGYGPIASDRDLIVVSKPYDENMIAAAFRLVMKEQCLDSE
ncbi:CheY-like chemotaxis protein [Limimaricola soesokkakensis]|uniref:CheY-like chemotaxis protein n=1 Tax=Limimaricola soesokkakensis TaxID=1343159 RepID=A0A1X6Z573_9RHOB|nr:response regulator [Limimaricola soesokkakensis]PSK81811.1 CheY-like chemotaxis protein [Limimaricola soesokkakensis]SLN39148.1 two-component response regulator [Limimaricola soesokkakensis]